MICPICSGRGQAAPGVSCPVCKGKGVATPEQASEHERAMAEAAVQGALARMRTAGAAAADDWLRTQAQVRMEAQEARDRAVLAAGRAEAASVVPASHAIRAIEAADRAEAAAQKITDWAFPPYQQGGPSPSLPGATLDPGRVFDSLLVRELDVWGPMRAPMFAPGILPSGDTSGFTDTNTIQNVLNAGGLVQLASGTFYVTNLTVPSTQGMSGNGASTIIKAVGTGACIFMHSGLTSPPGFGTLTDQMFGGYLRDFIVDGSTHPTGISYGLDVGDPMWDYDIRHVLILHFNQSGDIGFNGINRTAFTEKCTIDVTCFDCDTGAVLDRAPAGQPSWEYNDLRFCLLCHENQNGLIIRNGAYINNGSLAIRGNFNTSNTGPLTNACLTLTGSGGGQNSHISDSLVLLTVESNNAHTYGPATIVFGASSNSMERNSGVISFSDSPWSAAVNAGANFTFTGVINDPGDTGLLGGNQIIGAVLTGPVSITGAGGATEGDLLKVNNTAGTPTASPVEFQGATAADKLFGAQVAGDADSRFTFDTNGSHKWGSGSAAADARLQRTGAGVMQFDPNSGAATAELDIAGSLGLVTKSAPSTPTGRCLLYYDGTKLWAVGVSGTPVALATT